MMLFVGVGLVAWLLQKILTRDFRVVRTPLNIVVALYVAVQLISTIMSISKTTSLWGFYGRGNGSLINTFVYAGLYVLIVNVFSDKEDLLKLVWTVVGASVFAAVYGLLQAAGFYLLPFDFTKYETFNTVSGVTGLAMIFVPVLGLALGMLLSKKGRFTLTMSAAVGIFIIVFGLLNPSGFSLVVIVAGLAVIGAALWRREFNSKVLIVSGALILLAAILLFFPKTGLRVPSEVQLGKKFAWQETTAVLGQYPLVGTGPETFIYDFSRFRPAEINRTPLWSLRFDQADNEFFNALATTGLTGFAALILLLGTALIIALAAVTEKKDNELAYVSVGLFAALLTLAAAMSVTYLNTASAVLLWSLVGLIGALRSGGTQPENQGPEQTELKLLTYAALTVVSIAAIAGIYTQFRNLAADTKYRDGLKASQNVRQFAQAYDSLKQATGLNSRNDLYNLAIARVLLMQVNLEGKKDKPDTKIIQTNLTEAINRGKYAVQLVPVSPGNWEALASIYRNAGTYAADALPLIEKSYLKALTLEPTNPVIVNALGQVNLTRRDFSKAKQRFEQAIKLKADYADPYINLGLLYKDKKEYDKAIKEFETALKLQPNNKQVQQEKAAVEALLKAPKAETPQPAPVGE